MTIIINSAQRLQTLAESERQQPFSVGFDSPDGFHRVNLLANDHQHAQQLLRYLRLNARLEGLSRDSPGEDPIDSVSLDVPTLIRVMELSREEVKSDEELHHVVEKLLRHSKSKSGGAPLNMDDYSLLFPSDQTEIDHDQTAQ